MASYRSLASDHLSSEEVQEMREHGTLSGGSIGDGWEALLGGVPEERMYYEFQLYRPSRECPYIEKYFARILVTRDRASGAVHILWRPPVPEYHGPHFE
ncbi:MAG: hypothetical protein C5B50_00135 [Verrucomicrobia bacterium]|nr:MAG: hypothetical protein C5B50_00135 [Verrucomicrobiota bacterium]